MTDPADIGLLTSNPYEGQGAVPYKVQLHAHSTESDGALSPINLVSAYEALGYDALAITDHALNTVQPESTMIAIPSSETHSTTSYHITSPFSTYYAEHGTVTNQNIINAIVADGGLPIVAHPTYSSANAYNVIAALTGYTGIEIFNSVCEYELENTGYAVATWDKILTNVSRNIWGFAADDLHINLATTKDKGKILVFATAKSSAAIKSAIAAGAFVSVIGSPEVTFNPPSVMGRSVSVSCPGADTIRFRGKGGSTLGTFEGDSAEYIIQNGDTYTRIEVVVDGVVVGYYQPISIGS